MTSIRHTPMWRALPGPVRKAADRLALIHSTGVLADPLALLRQLRHHIAFGRLQRALFYQRYATALLLGHEIGLYDLLADGPRSAAAVAQRSGIHARAADALLRILESEGMLTRCDEGFRLTPFARLYLARDGRHTVAPLLSLMAAQAASFGGLVDGVRSGQTPPALDIFSTDGRYQAFLDAVNDYLRWAARDLLSRIELPPIGAFIVGSMGVSFSAALLERQPNARVTYGCLPHLVAEVPRLCATYEVPAAQIDGRHEHGGEPEDDRWGCEAYDLVLLTKKMILEPDKRLGERFAKKAFDVLNPGGVAILWETLHADAHPTPIGRAMEAVLDLATSPTGLVTSEGGMVAMLQRIGYVDVEIVPCLGDQTTFVVARRPAR